MSDRPSPPPGYAPAVTGFRGLGSLLVVVVHVFLATRIFPWVGALHILSIVLPIFFAISAYSLYRPFVERQVANLPPKPKAAFWWKRFLRIYPLYAVALTTYLVLLPGVRPPGNRVIDYVKLYAFAQIYDPDLAVFSGIPAAWFLGDEVVFYLLLPGFAWLGLWAARQPLLRSRGRRTDRILRGHVLLGVALVLVGQISRLILVGGEYPGATALPITNFDFYGLGMLLAVASVHEQHGGRLPRSLDRVRTWRWTTPLALALGTGAMALIAASPDTSGGGGEDVRRYTVYFLIVAPVMAAMTLGAPDRSTNRLLASPRWFFLAKNSLHIYLWHQLFIGAFDRFVMPSADIDLGPRVFTGAVALVGFCLVTVVWSAIWQPLLDLPYLRWSGVIPRRAGAPSLPPGLRPAAVAVAMATIVAGVWVSLTWGGSDLQVHGGTEQVTVLGAHEGDALELVRSGQVQHTGEADEHGSAVLRRVAPGDYELIQRRGNRTITQRAVTVGALGDHPDPSFYARSVLEPGLQEIITRDGTALSALVWLPGPVEEGPYPTVVETSAYRIADPGMAQTATAIARAFGFATVSVNTRGTGCSAGAFGMLGPTEAADGYDVVETVAAQPWVRNHRVGLVGFSFSGLTALLTAAAAPPSLNSTAALSTYGWARNTFHPGGLANSGFPVGWLEDMMEDATPPGAAWISDRIAAGDQACARNQLLHTQTEDLGDLLLGNDADRSSALFDQLSPASWAPMVTVPTFLGAQLQDATVGNDLADTLRLYVRSPLTKLVLTNGSHGDGISGQMLERLHQFLMLYAAEETPQPLDQLETLRKADPDADPDLVMDHPAPPLQFAPDEPVEQARARYEQADAVELLVNTGGGDRPGAAAATGTTSFSTWPPAEATPVDYRLAPGGRLLTAADAGGDGPDVTLNTVPGLSGSAYNVEGSSLLINAITPWRPPTAGTAVAWISDPLERSQLLVGNTSVELWVRTATSADLQVVLSHVSAAAEETLVQVGWQRLRSGDGAATTEDGWRQVRVELGPTGQLYEAGSRLRLQVGTPGDGQVQWSFYPPPAGSAKVAISQDGDRPGILRVGLLDAPADLGGPVACGDLRAQPCRPYVPLPTEEPNR